MRKALWAIVVQRMSGIWERFVSKFSHKNWWPHSLTGNSLSDVKDNLRQGILKWSWGNNKIIKRVWKNLYNQCNRWSFVSRGSKCWNYLIGCPRKFLTQSFVKNKRRKFHRTNLGKCFPSWWTMVQMDMQTRRGNRQPKHLELSSTKPTWTKKSQAEDKSLENWTSSSPDNGHHQHTSRRRN